MEPEIAKAIIGVMKDVKPIIKDNENKFAKYNFASIDDFLDLINPLCAKHGLAILMGENDFVVENKQIVMAYDFTLIHESGATYYAGKRTIVVQNTGSQALGSAQSYIQKFFMRSLFLIPTHEEDDASDHKPVKKRQKKETSGPENPPEKSSDDAIKKFFQRSSYEIPLENIDPMAWATKISGAMEKATSVYQIEKLWADNKLDKFTEKNDSEEYCKVLKFAYEGNKMRFENA